MADVGWEMNFTANQSTPAICHLPSAIRYGVAFTWAKIDTSIDMPDVAACENAPP
jgi:hypothetical protein